MPAAQTGSRGGNAPSHQLWRPGSHEFCSCFGSSNRPLPCNRKNRAGAARAPRPSRACPCVSDLTRGLPLLRARIWPPALRGQIRPPGRAAVSPHLNRAVSDECWPILCWYSGNSLNLWVAKCVRRGGGGPGSNQPVKTHAPPAPVLAQNQLIALRYCERILKVLAPGCLREDSETGMRKQQLDKNRK